MDLDSSVTEIDSSVTEIDAVGPLPGAETPRKLINRQRGVDGPVRLVCLRVRRAEKCAYSQPWRIFASCWRYSPWIARSLLNCRGDWLGGRLLVLGRRAINGLPKQLIRDMGMHDYSVHLFCR
jgi:hypothetical protein